VILFDNGGNELKKYNILIFPAGSEIALEIYDSLKYNLHFNVFGASGKPDHAKYSYPLDHYIEGEDLYITGNNFTQNFNKVLETYNIDYIFPTHDSVALYLSEHQHLVHATLICSDQKTTRIARSKKKIYQALKGCPFIPHIFDRIDEIMEYPVFLKPDIGEGGMNTWIANNRVELNDICSKVDDLIVSEYLPGEEFSIDCFTNREGELLFVGPRTRQRVTIGISFHSERIPLSKEILEIAHKLNEYFSFRGAWFFQVKTDKAGQPKLMEFAIRQASTMGLYRQLGVNFALLSLFDFIGYDVKVLLNDYEIVLDRCLHNEYKLSYDYNRIYVDFDDTLIMNDKVNTLLMRLIYQCINSNKQVILLTKHACDLDESLSKYRIGRELFDEIILIKPEDKKADYIVTSKAIFIDNYFPERLYVKEICNIPVFDVDAIECLIDSSAL